MYGQCWIMTNNSLNNPNTVNFFNSYVFWNAHQNVVIVCSEDQDNQTEIKTPQTLSPRNDNDRNFGENLPVLFAEKYISCTNT